jgi:protoporphyrinogen/coproporphyrinogen III oxidase
VTAPTIVAGGGITGLVAARTLARIAPSGARVVLLEATDRLGGKIQTHRWNGAAIEAGPDWFLSDNDVVPSLCRELGLGHELVEPVTSGAMIWSRGRLEPLPAGFVRGVPASLPGLLRCPLLSPRGRLRGLGDLLLSGPLRGPDISVGELVRRRFGHEVLERLVDPILAASRSGSADELSLAAATPEIDDAARRSRSVLVALRNAARSRPTFRGLARGMDSLVDALVTGLGPVEVVVGTRLVAVERRDHGFKLTLDNGSVDADAVVLAVPAPSAAGALRSLDPRLAAEVDGIRYTSAAVVSFVYPPGSVRPPSGRSGFLVPSDDGRLITAAGWYSAKWANAGPRDGSFVIRCFAGRSPDDPLLRLSDDVLETRMAHEFALASGVEAVHERAFVSRWPEALPVYNVGHVERVARIEKLARRHRGLALAGAGYRGSGLPDCIAAGRAAAEQIASH